MPNALASPKSANFSSPFLFMSKFCGLRSRWSTLWLWQNARPRSSWYMKLFTTSKSMSPFKLSKYFFKSWSQCSKTRVSFLSECSTSYRRTIFLCFSSCKWKIEIKSILPQAKFRRESISLLIGKFLWAPNSELPLHLHPDELVSAPQFPMCRDFSP